jgi:hypothetical protein
MTDQMVLLYEIQLFLRVFAPRIEQTTRRWFEFSEFIFGYSVCEQQSSREGKPLIRLTEY